MTQSAVRLLPGLLAAAVLLSGIDAARAQTAPDWEQRGQATWYGARHHGRRTSSGEVFNQFGMTAAHSSLPLGSRVRVTREDTGESVVVTVNDRMPPQRYRIIDLARGAADRLGMVSAGVSNVTIRLADDEPLEVAEAPGLSPQPRGRPRTPRVTLAGAAGLPCYPGPSEAPAPR